MDIKIFQSFPRSVTQKDFITNRESILEILRKYREGLICTSACAGGVVSTHLINDDYDKAREIAKSFKEIFEDDFYLEIQDHGMDIEKPILEGMPKISKKLGIKLVATNDCHYIEKEHAICA